MGGKYETKLYSFSQVLPHLYIAGFGCIEEKKLRELGITHGVDATNLKNKLPLEEVYTVPVDDSLLANLGQYFEAVNDFIDGAKAKGTGCVVFCAAGVSRSAALVLGYLVSRAGMSLRDAYFHLNEARPIVAPNVNFWRQLLAHEQHIRNEQTVRLVGSRGGGGRPPYPDVYLHRSERMGGNRAQPAFPQPIEAAAAKS